MYYHLPAGTALYWRSKALRDGERQIRKLAINQKVYEVTAPDEMPLLWVLRDLVGLKGTKFGCGIAQCGACTVHIDGQPTRSCVTPVGSIGKSKITTIEGLGLTPAGSKIKAAWESQDVPQCGYCQAGQMMSAAALLNSTPHPNDAEIDNAMEGNFCRCATYKRIRAAIKTASGTDAADRREG